MNRSAYLEKCIKLNEELLEKITALFSSRTEEVLKMPPKEGAWSAWQCLQHINITLALYLRNIRKELANSPEDIGEKFGGNSFLGKQVIRGVSLKDDGSPRMPQKTFRKMDPRVQDDGQDGIRGSLNFFRESTVSMAEQMVLARKRRIHRIKVPTAISWLKITVADAFLFYLKHTERHLAQMERAIDNAKENV